MKLQDETKLEEDRIAVSSVKTADSFTVTGSCSVTTYLWLISDIRIRECIEWISAPLRPHRLTEA